MSGWQRFGILLVCIFAVMVLFPNYDGLGLSFLGMAFILWTGGIILLSLITNIFALYRWETFNRVLTFAVFFAIVYTLLWYFPQEDKVSPINKLKYGQYPTKADIDKGIKRLTFNFDFLHRNALRDENYSNQKEIVRPEQDEKNPKQAVKKQAKQLIEIFVEDEK